MWKKFGIIFIFLSLVSFSLHSQSIQSDLNTIDTLFPSINLNLNNLENQLESLKKSNELLRNSLEMQSNTVMEMSNILSSQSQQLESYKHKSSFWKTATIVSSSVCLGLGITLVILVNNTNK